MVENKPRSPKPPQADYKLSLRFQPALGSSDDVLWDFIMNHPIHTPKQAILEAVRGWYFGEAYADRYSRGVISTEEFNLNRDYGLNALEERLSYIRRRLHCLSALPVSSTPSNLEPISVQESDSGEQRTISTSSPSILEQNVNYDDDFD